MEMIQKNSRWQQKTEVKKGDLGEELVENFLTKKGYIIYKPVTDGGHAFDRVIHTKNGKKLCVVEVKTKAIMNKYPATGIDYSAFKGYMEINKNHNMNVRLVFVDELLGEVYYYELNKESEKEE
ncbi:MAG: hypothetical protein ACRC5T_09635, partial [Cetobacterium sp.]